MSLRQKAIGGALWSTAEKWGAQCVSTIIFLLLARLLGAEAFGLIALANVFLSFMQVFLDQGFAQAIVQKDRLEPEHLDTAFWTSILMGVLFIFAIFTTAHFVANVYDEPELTPIIQWMSLSFLFSGLSSVHSAVLQRNMQFKVFAARSLIATVACGLAGVGAALMGYGVWSLVVKEIVFGFTGAALLWGACPWRPGLKFSVTHFRELFSFGINVVGFNFLTFFYRRSDDMLIGYFLGSVALGYYSVAYRLVLIMVQLLTSVTTQVALPAFSRLQNQPEKIRSAFYKITQFTSLVSFPIFLGMAALTPELVLVIFGDQWLPSIPVMRILALAGVLQSVYAFNGTILLAMNKPFWRLIFQSINVTANVAIFFVAVQWGIVAVALGYAIRSYVLSPLPLLMIKKLIQIDFRNYWLQFRSPLMSSLVMVICIFGFKLITQNALGNYLSLASLSLISVLAYTITLSLIQPDMFQQIKSNIVAISKS